MVNCLSLFGTPFLLPELAGLAWPGWNSLPTALRLAGGDADPTLGAAASTAGIGPAISLTSGRLALDRRHGRRVAAGQDRQAQAAGRAVADAVGQHPLDHDREPVHAPALRAGGKGDLVAGLPDVLEPLPVGRL